MTATCGSASAGPRSCPVTSAVRSLLMPGDGLCVEQQQDRGDSVGDRCGGLLEAVVEQPEPLFLLEGVADAGFPVRKAHGRQASGGAGPSDERPVGVAGGRPAGQPGVNVGLPQVLGGDTALVQVGKELPGDGDLLFGGADGAGRQGACVCGLPDPAQLVPGGECLEELLHLFGVAGRCSVSQSSNAAVCRSIGARTPQLISRSRRYSAIFGCGWLSSLT